MLKKTHASYIVETQTIDAAFAMVESLGWGLHEWEDPHVQAAAMAGAEQFIRAVRLRLPAGLAKPK